MKKIITPRWVLFSDDIRDSLHTFCIHKAGCIGTSGFLFVCFFIWVLRPIQIISLLLIPVNHEVGQKLEIPKKNHLTTRKQNLTGLKCDPSWAGTHSGKMTSD